MFSKFCDKTGQEHALNETLVYGFNLFNLNLTWPWAGPNVEMNATMEFYVTNDPYNIQEICVLYFHTMALFDLTFTLTFGEHELLRI